MKRSLIHWLGLTGIAALLSYAAAVIFAPFAYPAITGWRKLSAICQQKLHHRDNYGTSWQRLITFAA